MLYSGAGTRSDIGFNMWDVTTRTTSKLTDWDGSHGPTNTAVGEGIGGIWKAVPKVKIEIENVFTCAEMLTCVAEASSNPTSIRAN